MPCELAMGCRVAELTGNIQYACYASYPLLNIYATNVVRKRTMNASTTHDKCLVPVKLTII